MTRAEMLRAAAALIAAAVASLDTSGYVCDECDATRRKNWTEYQAAVSLRHLPAKLHDQASRLEHHDDAIDS